MERVIVCPVCKDSDTCFEEMQEHLVVICVSTVVL